MDRSTIAPLTTIHPGHPLRLQDGAGTRISVLHGKAWVTQDADAADRLLTEGDDFVLDRGGLSLVTALEEEAQVSVTPPAPVRTSLWARIQRASIDRARLHAMQDRELRDIGLCRSQIELIGR